MSRVHVFNPSGKPAVSRRFLERIGTLPPSSRNLALAMACTRPWRNRPHELPEAYNRELEHARWLAQCEHDAWETAEPFPEPAYQQAPTLDLDYLFMDEPEPILGETLELLADKPPYFRSWALAFSCRMQWSEEPGGNIRDVFYQTTGLDWGEPEEVPEWIRRFETHTKVVLAEQYGWE